MSEATKWYAIEYGKIRKYDVVKETAKTLTVRGRWSSGDKESRMDKAGVFPSLREALADEQQQTAKRVDEGRKCLAEDESELAALNALLDKPDDELLEEAKKVFRY